MAIRIKTLSATDLRLAANIAKRAFGTAITVAGTAGKVAGFWQAAFVRLPASGFTNNTIYQFWGHDGNNAGNFNGGQDHWIGIGGDNVSQGALRLKPRVYARSNSNNAYSAAQDDFTALSALTANGADVYALIYGVQNTGTDESPVWKGWAARVLVGGDVSSEVDPTALNAAYISNTSGILLSQLFNSRPTGSSRSPVNLAYENLAHVNGDFPWDTANDRPHHDALLALAAGSGAPATLHSYASLIGAQNAGTLGYANLRSGAKADLTHFWTLADLTAGLVNAGNGGSNTLAPTNWNSLSDGLEAVSIFTPPHWTPNPTITEPGVKGVGGQGSLANTVAGAYQSAFVTGMERRWTLAGSPVSGFDWAAVNSFSGGAWSITDTLPIGGPYTLEVRATNNNSYAASSAGWLVGTKYLHHSQSGGEQVLQGGADTFPGVNRLGLAVASGAIGRYIKLSNQSGGTAASYAQPSLTQVDLISGQTPAVSQGVVKMLNEWNSFNPGHPLIIVNMAISGTLMPDWADNATASQGGTAGHASWKFMGTIGAVPDAAGGNNSGVVEYLAQLLGRHVDCHGVMWTPGMSSVAGTAGSPDTSANATAGSRRKYRLGIDERFSNSVNAPWMILPPWRGSRAPPDASQSVAKRQEHIDFVAELGSRGYLGPQWSDIVTDGNPSPGSLHPAFHSTASAGGGGSPTSDQNQVGQARLASGYGWALARVYDDTVKSIGAMVLAAWSDDGRATVNIETGRRLRTLNGAAIHAGAFWVSTDNGANFINTGFTVALDATTTRVILTAADGGTAWAAAGSNLRVDYGREWPFNAESDETLTERKLDGLLYDDQTYRGGTNFAAGLRPGNVLQGTNRTGAGLAGVAVTVRGAARLLGTQRRRAALGATIRMVVTGGANVDKPATAGVA